MSKARHACLKTEAIPELYCGTAGELGFYSQQLLYSQAASPCHQHLTHTLALKGRKPQEYARVWNSV